MHIRLKSGVHSEHLRASQIYPVYAVYIANTSDFLVMGQLHSFPISVNINDVEIVDNRLSKYWTFGYSDSQKWSTILSFSEWSSDPFFYQNLVEGKSDAGEVFRKYQSKIENEYAEVNLADIAIELENEWFQCPFCEEAWKDNDTSEVLVCPSCKKRLRKS